MVHHIFDKLRGRVGSKKQNDLLTRLLDTAHKPCSKSSLLEYVSVLCSTQQHPPDPPSGVPPPGELGEEGLCWGPNLMPFASLLMSKTPS